MIHKNGLVTLAERTFRYVYVIKNIKNNKVYIGQTNSPESRLYQHFTCGTWSFLTEAIKKFGQDNFQMRIISKHSCRKEANQAESDAIVKYDSAWPNGYNARAPEGKGTTYRKAGY